MNFCPFLRIVLSLFLFCLPVIAQWLTQRLTCLGGEPCCFPHINVTFSIQDFSGLSANPCLCWHFTLHVDIHPAFSLQANHLSVLWQLFLYLKSQQVLILDDIYEIFVLLLNAISVKSDCVRVGRNKNTVPFHSGSTHLVWLILI